MIGYVTVGTNDLARAASFYDRLLEKFGAQRIFESEHAVMWGVSGNPASLCVTVPFDGKPATRGNGTMVALLAASTDQVDAVHQLALSLGGSDEGAPGLRGTSFYAAYFRDLDGNKLNCFLTL